MVDREDLSWACSLVMASRVEAVCWDGVDVPVAGEEALVMVLPAREGGVSIRCRFVGRGRMGIGNGVCSLEAGDVELCSAESEAAINLRSANPSSVGPVSCPRFEGRILRAASRKDWSGHLRRMG